MRVAGVILFWPYCHFGREYCLAYDERSLTGPLNMWLAETLHAQHEIIERARKIQRDKNRKHIVSRKDVDSVTGNKLMTTC